MGSVRVLATASALAVFTVLAGCGGSTSDDLFGDRQSSTGGAPASGGAPMQLVGGGATATGGASGSGGATGAGGGIAAGGAPGGTGGALGSAGGSQSAGGTGGAIAAAGGAGTGDGGSAGDGGSVSTGGSGPAGGGGGGPACIEGAEEACTCVDATGTRTCKSGVFGDCVCGGPCKEGAESPCRCPDGSPGVARCSGGAFSACTDCPVGPSGCPLGMRCSATGGGSSTYLCVEAGTSLPPSCTVTADCATLDVGCITLPFLGGVCFKTCTP